MKTLILFSLFILFLVSVQFASAQTVDEIIDKYLAARGGKEKLLSIKTIYMEGSREMMGNEVAVKVTKEQGKLSRTEFEMGGTNGFMLITEKEAWNFFPMRSPTPSKMPDDAVAALQTELDIAGPLVDYVAKGHKAEFIAKETMDDIVCYKIKLTTKSGKVINYWIDISTNLITQSSTKGGGMFGGGKKTEGEAPADVITMYKDYKAVDGIMFAHNIETKNPSGQGRGSGGTTFDKIELNKPVDAKLYKPE
ncbi:MAG: hypothetical protein IPP72_08890 [Chitinophagaceae bacterium]|nr:hypothetical protein [Chitinophagaceae bacterium]